MKYIIFDLEFNTAFKIDRQTKRLVKGNANPLCPQEIIELGAVKVNTNFKIEETFNIFIKPNLYKILHPKVKQKTKITKEDLLTGHSLIEGINMFKDWIAETPEEFTLCSWGMDDIRELKRNCMFYRIKTNWIQRYCDIQKLCMAFLDLPKGQQLGLKAAVKELNIEMDHSFHKALNDSIYTTRIFKEIQLANDKTT